MEFKYKKVLIFGYGRSGKSVEQVLKEIGVDYCVHDQKIKIDGGCFLIKLSRKVLSQFDLVVLSPGVSIFNKYIRMAESMGIKVISELEFGFWFTTAEIIAVTGTNGKTTTVNLINKMLGLAGYNSCVYGNVGVPLSNGFGKDLDYIVCEVSSFQLEATDKFLPYISILLNVDSDHIDRHKNFKNYYDCKKALFKNCKNDDHIILNFDDANCRKIASEISGNIHYFSSKKEQEVYLKNDKVYFGDEKYLNVNSLIVSDNILVLCGVAKILNIESDIVSKTLEDVSLMHRQEVVAKHKGVTYINDSKATNVHAVMKALDGISNRVILLLGGRDKNLDFSPIIERFSDSNDEIVIFGEVRKKLVKDFKNKNIKFHVEKTLKEGIDKAVLLAGKNDTVLLSPACASFDEFSNYEERGDFFKNYILDRVKNVKN